MTTPSAILTKAQLSANSILINTTQNAAQELQAYQNLYTILFNPPVNAGFTSTDILAALGVRAAATLGYLQAMLEKLQTVDPASIPAPVATVPAYAAHDDGTVTLS